MVGLCSRLCSEAQLCADLTVDDLFWEEGVGGWGGGGSQLPLHTYGKGWK